MPREVTRTLQATLVEPTAGKEQRLRRLLNTYREALHESFESGADTMSAVNDIVTPYDLPYQAKDALKSHVPKLRRSYNANDLDAGSPLRLVKRAAKFDHSDDRKHEFVWQVPQSGRGTNFWIPIQTNPEQDELWFELLDGDVEAGQIQLQRRNDSWELLVSVSYELDEATDTDDVTYIGFDVGESALITGCALKRDVPREPMVLTGNRARHLRKELSTTMKRLQERDAAEWRIDERADYYQNALTDIVEQATREAVDYASQFDSPVIVLEDLTYIRESLDYSKWMNRRLHNWAFARIQSRIEDKAVEQGIRVEYVNAAYTSQTCHDCGYIGSRSGDAFRCTNGDCHVTEFHADINAAANIADRANPWGESLLWKSGDDDMPRDGSGCDTATVHCETSEKPSQMTLTAYSD